MQKYSFQSWICVMAVIVTSSISLRSQTLNVSNLPIIIVDTRGETIVDEPKITADMWIIGDGSSDQNSVNSTDYHYQGQIGIELRGQSSQNLFPKKGYGIETREANGDNNNVSLFGMPDENDWVIHSPYSDKSLMRNALAYKLAAQIMPYAPRVQFCELIVNDDYQGVVLFTEKIKVDKNRVDINKLKDDENDGDDLTGGYLMRFDKFDTGQEIAWVSPYAPSDESPQETRFIYHTPKYDEVTDEQRNYIKNWITGFENVLASDGFALEGLGYDQYIDVQSFIDFMLVNEISKNIDGYRLSTYFYKDKDSDGGLLHMGPVWDFNLAFGNANYCEGDSHAGWEWDYNLVCPDHYWNNHFWWKRLLEDPKFENALRDRWQELRATIWADDQIEDMITSMREELGGAWQRNFVRWPVIGIYIWPNPFIGQNYLTEVNYLTDWLLRRMAWMDGAISNVTSSADELDVSDAVIISPNPADQYVDIELSQDLTDQSNTSIMIMDQQGRTILDRHLATAKISINTSEYPAGIYHCQIISDQRTVARSRLLITH